jgi:hypothetical protein
MSNPSESRDELINEVGGIAFDADLAETKRTNRSFFKRCQCSQYEADLCYFCINEKAKELADFILARESSLKDRIGELEEEVKKGMRLALKYDALEKKEATLRKRVLEPLEDMQSVYTKGGTENETLNRAIAILKSEETNG